MKTQIKNTNNILPISAFVFTLLITVLFISCQNVSEQELLNTYQQLAKENKDSEAKETLEELIRHFPNNSIALNNLAVSLINEKKYEEANVYLQKAKENARMYSTSDTVTMIALFNKNNVLVVFRIVRPGYSISNTTAHIEYNLEKLTTYSSY